MPVINELIRSEKDGTLSFGNYKLDTKSKLSDFEHCGDSYKVKTFKVYESVPGTAVMNFKAADTGLSFTVEGSDDAQITVELEEGASYNVTINGVSEGTMATNMGGKIVLSVSLEEGKSVSVEVVKA